MDALILAAGEGTRLLPLTGKRPKPLFPVLNQPLLQSILEYLHCFSIDRVIMNTHHLAGQIEQFAAAQKKGPITDLETRYEPAILNTGGGLVNTRDFFRSDPFMVISGDILTDIDLKKALEFHRSHPDPVTLVLHDYPEFNRTKVDPDGRIRKFRTDDHQGLDFANIYILDREVFRFLPSSGNFDIIPAFQGMIDRGIPLWGYVSQPRYWWNIGTPKSYLQVHEQLLTGKSVLKYSLASSSPPGRPAGVLIHSEARIEEEVEFSGWACIGRGCCLKKGCRIQNSVLWEDVRVESGITVSGSIIGDGVRVKADQQDAVLI